MHVFLYKAKDAELRGDHVAAQNNRYLSAMCNFGAIVTFLIFTITFVILLASGAFNS